MARKINNRDSSRSRIQSNNPQGYKGNCQRLNTVAMQIIVEGVGERKYFQKIKDTLHYNYIIVGGTKASDSYSVAHIQDTEKAYKSGMYAGLKTYWVLDLDTIYLGNGAHKDEYNTFKNAYKDRIVFCDSMPSFEYWLLMHFANYGRKVFSLGDDLKDLQRFLPGYNKTNVDGLTMFFEKSNIEKACAKAETIKYNHDSESHTNVYKIHRELV